MSKLQVGKFELNKEWAKINEIIEKVISSLKPAAEKKGLELKGDYQAGLTASQVDVRRLEQVVYNLVENGIKYTNNGGITVRTFLTKESIIIEIRDTGIGIPKKELPKIWDRFYRVDKSRTRKTGGTGLGLYVAKQIIESHDGDINVKSKENEGTIFSIYLSEKSLYKDETGEKKTMKKILIVDDEIEMRQLLKIYLRQDNYQVDEAENGQEAYEKIIKNDYELMILML